jgi:hypothetical protein
MWYIIISLFLIHHFDMFSAGNSYIRVIGNVSLVMSNTNSTLMNGTCNQCLCAALLNSTMSISSFNCFHNNNTCEMFTLSLANGSYSLMPLSTSSLYLFPLLTYKTISTTAFFAKNTSDSSGELTTQFFSNLRCDLCKQKIHRLY